ncbi:unnamed protein product [Psylliodes chrysocephalus]|uniref:Homologous-pairing protein 2 homolog n=1 Tax=Psylliodes chrysocephalus TaxID=3402493 RepID=A0A9P0GK86_9CUCU|nr:unnamed protein product [Psylliodes chrysocephala]
MACNEAVLKFLEDHNRPFSNSDIQSGVKGDFGKSAIQKALDFLVQKGKVKEKAYGKQKVYCIVQGSGTSTSELREQILEMDRAINERTIHLKELTDQYKSKVKLISELKGQISLTDAIEQKVTLDQEIQILEEKLKQYEGTELIEPQRKKEVQKHFDKYLNEYKKRKRLCMDMLNAILENYPKSKKHLFDDIGIETDEDVGFSLQLDV